MNEEPELELDEDGEFDIQKTILRTKTQREQTYYIRYDKLTYNVLAITPEDSLEDDPRQGIISSSVNDLITGLFTNKLSLSNLKIKYDYKNRTRLLIRDRHARKGEFDYVFGSKHDSQYIHLDCDVVTKTIRANFLIENFKKDYTNELATETQISRIPEYLEIFCIDGNERSRLYDKLSLNVKKLVDVHELSFRCRWLPDSEDQFDRIAFVHYDHDLQISASSSPVTTEAIDIGYKPAIIYKQNNYELCFQSVINNHRHLFINNDRIVFYIYNAFDPSEIIGSIDYKTEILDNYNMFSYEMKTNKPVKIITNYPHIHIENVHDNSYYKF